MTKMEWLEDRLRYVCRIQSHDEDEREGKLVGVFALWGHHPIEFETWTLEEAIRQGLSYETRRRDPRLGDEIDEVVLTRVEVAALHRDRKQLAALVHNGVREWEHYDSAMDMVEDE